MSSSFLILALAGSALAVPRSGEQAHYYHRQHNHFHASGVAHQTGTGAPYALYNATGIYGATGTAAGTAASTGFPVSSDLDAVTRVADVSSSSSCTSRSTVRVTETQQVTVIVTQSSAPNATSVAEDEEEAPVETSSSLTLELQKKAYQGKQRTWRRSSSSTVSTTASSSSSAAAAVSTTAKTSSTSVSVAPTSSSSSVSVYVAPSSSSSAVVVVSTTSSSAASQTASSGTGKRGVAYNDASLTTPFVGAKEVSWGYNWGQSPSGLSTSLNFVPLLWGTSSTFTNGWDASVKAAKSAGSTHLFSFNEPDLSSQSNMSPQAAAAAYKTYMQPYAGQFKLGAPSVTNGGGALGLNWLDAFIKACDGCTIDFVNIHWYDSASNVAYFKEHVANATEVAGGRPVWLTEFGCTSGSDSEISTFLETVMPWMDSQSFVERYSYFMVADGNLVSGGKASTIGSTFMSYTA